MKLVDYVSEIGRALSDIDAEIGEAVERLKLMNSNRNTLWVLGNGGSMAIAQHFAQDLLKMRGMRAQTVNCPSILTAFTNDHAFDYSFYLPIKTLAEQGDVLMIFSCSGSSRNYIEFLSWKFLPIISVVGTDGGFLKGSSDVCIHVKSHDYALCESAFSIIADMISMGLRGEEEGDSVEN